jgi:hypothetical protein
MPGNEYAQDFKNPVSLMQELKTMAQSISRKAEKCAASWS